MDTHCVVLDMPITELLQAWNKLEAEVVATLMYSKMTCYHLTPQGLMLAV